jgi:hypothetical protein
MSQTSSEILNQRFPGIVTRGDGTRLNPFAIRTPSPTASTLAQIFLLENVYGAGSYRRSARTYFQSALGMPGNQDLCEYRVGNDEGSLWFDLSFVTKLSEDPSLRAERNRIEEGMPLAGSRFVVVDAHTSVEAGQQIIFRLNQARAEGWHTGNAVSKAWHNEYDITKDGVNSKLLFDLRPTIGRVNRMELTLVTMAAAQPQAREKLARMESSIRPKAAGCVVLVFALVSSAALLGTAIVLGAKLACVAG